MYISSAAAYYTPPSRPFITEGMLLKNTYWQYARDKIASEEILIDAMRTKDFPVTIIRPSHTYSERYLPFCLEGPKGSWSVIQRMREGKPIIMPGDGSSLWTITFNEDVAKGFVGLMGNVHAIGEAVHITNDEPITWNQMAQAVADILKVPYKPYYIPTDVLTAIEPEWDGGHNGDKRHSVIYDNSKVKQLVPDYCATIPWRVGAERALNTILKDPSLQPQDPAFDKWCDDIISIYDKALADAKSKCGRLY
jgi:nucleoside-diphosphate-sugar epimerase